MIWREKRPLLLLLAGLLIANTAFFFTYRVQYQGRLDALDERLRNAETQLAQARSARAATERTYQSYKQIERDVKVIFDQHWSTQTERLTALIAEVKRLAVNSSLVPAAYGYQRARVVDDARVTGRRERDTIGATEVGIGFQVAGTYEQARRLINLLELSRQFVIIDQISLFAGEGQTLTLNLHLKTLFRDEKTGAARL